jgi:hypothetical protein
MCLQYRQCVGLGEGLEDVFHFRALIQRDRGGNRMRLAREIEDCREHSAVDADGTAGECDGAGAMLVKAAAESVQFHADQAGKGEIEKVYLALV